MPASNVISRKTVREALATGIDGVFNSDWDIFNYKTVAFNGKARNIVVASAGSRREIKGADADESDSSFRFRVFVFVLYQDTANAWTSQNSEDALDGAEKALADYFDDNQTATYWSRLYIEGETDPDMIVDEGGQTFRREIINVRTEKYT
jgi:hypothetical protein